LGMVAVGKEREGRNVGAGFKEGKGEEKINGQKIYTERKLEG